MEGLPHSDPATLTALACAVVRSYSSLTTDIEDTEEFADVMLALWQAGSRYDPSRGSFSTFAYTVGRRAMYQGLTDRKGKSVSAVNEFEGYDAAETEDHFHSAEVRDEYNAVIEDAGLSPVESECLHSRGLDSSTRNHRYRAGAKVNRSAERRQLRYA